MSRKRTPQQHSKQAQAISAGQSSSGRSPGGFPKNPSEKRVRWALIGVLTAAGLVCWVGGFESSPLTFIRPDSWDYAQIGLQIGSGNGFSTLQVFPRHAVYHDSQGWPDDYWPELHRPPVVPLVSGILFALGVPAYWAIGLSSGIFYLLCVPLVYLLAERWFTRPAAIAASVLFLTCPEIRIYGANGMSESAGMFFRLLAVYLCQPAVQKRRWAPVLGVTMGLGLLSRADAIVFVPLCLLYMLWLARKTAWVPIGIAVGSLLLTCLPWWVRNTTLTGNPFFSFSTQRNLVLDPEHRNYYPELDLDFPVTTGEVVNKFGPQIREKFQRNLTRDIGKPFLALAKTVQPWWLLLAVPFALTLVRKREVLGGWLLVLLMFAGQIAAVSLFHHDRRFYVSFIPFALMLGIAGLLRLFDLIGRAAKTDPSRWPRAAGWLACTGLVIYGGVVSARPVIIEDLLPQLRRNPRLHQDANDLYGSLFRELQKRTSPDDVIVSDIAQMVCFHTRNRCVRLPVTVKDLLRLDDEYLEVDAVLIAGGLVGTPTSPPHRKYADYHLVDRRRDFTARFPRREQLPGGFILFQKGRPAGTPAATHGS